LFPGESEAVPLFAIYFKAGFSLYSVSHKKSVVSANMPCCTVNHECFIPRAKLSHSSLEECLPWQFCIHRRYGNFKHV